MKMYEDPPAEISHSAHPAHKLRLVTADGPPFRCDGCMDPGKGPRYRCVDGGCEFDLHTSCAVAKPTLKHPLLGDLEFQFLRQAPCSSGDAKFCAACGDTTPGFVYHCFEKDLGLHPCCAALQMESFLLDGQVLRLCKEAKHGCVICDEKARPPPSSSSSRKFIRASIKKEKLWAYRWHYGGSDGYLHVACMKKIAVQSWEQAYRLDNAGGVFVEASAPIMKGVLQGRQSRNTEGSIAEVISLLS